MEIRAIIGKDGEEYLNARDIAIILQKHAWEQGVPTFVVLSFVRRFIVNLITARRD